MMHERSLLLDDIGSIAYGFFGRKGGTSPREWSSLNTSYKVGDSESRVAENRSRICRFLKTSSSQLYTVNQVHGKNVIRIDSSQNNQDISQIDADAIWTTSQDALIGVTTADCAPILIASDTHPVVAAIHAGWKGAVGGVIQATVADICSQLSISPDSLVAVIGPTIGPHVYEVGQEVIEQAEASTSLEGLIETKEGSSYLDLQKLCQRLLLQTGVKKIEILHVCTFTRSDSFFSFRRDKGKTGRQLSAIRISDDVKAK